MKLNAKKNFGALEVLGRDQMRNIKGGTDDGLNPIDNCENLRSHTACYQGSTLLGVVSGSFGCPVDSGVRCYEDFATFTSFVCYCTS